MCEKDRETVYVIEGDSEKFALVCVCVWESECECECVCETDIARGRVCEKEREIVYAIEGDSEKFARVFAWVSFKWKYENSIYKDMYI